MVAHADSGVFFFSSSICFGPTHASLSEIFPKKFIPGHSAMARVIAMAEGGWHESVVLTAFSAVGSFDLTLFFTFLFHI